MMILNLMKEMMNFVSINSNNNDNDNNNNIINVNDAQEEKNDIINESASENNNNNTPSAIIDDIPLPPSAFSVVNINNNDNDNDGDNNNSNANISPINIIRPRPMNIIPRPQNLPLLSSMNTLDQIRLYGPPMPAIVVRLWRDNLYNK